MSDLDNVALFKDQGNKAFAAKDWVKAIELFSKALDLDPNNHVLWSNRSAAKAAKKDWEGALADAEQVVHPLIYLSKLIIIGRSASK